MTKAPGTAATTNHNSEGLLESVGPGTEVAAPIADSDEFPFGDLLGYVCEAVSALLCGVVGFVILMVWFESSKDHSAASETFMRIMAFAFIGAVLVGVWQFLMTPIKAQERLVVDSHGFRVTGPCCGCTTDKVDCEKVDYKWSEFQEVGIDLQCSKKKDKKDQVVYMRDSGGQDVLKQPAIVLRSGLMIPLGNYAPKSLTPQQFVEKLSMMAQHHAQYEPTGFPDHGDAAAQAATNPAAASTHAQDSSASSYTPPVVNQEQSSTTATPQSLAEFLAEVSLSQYETALRESPQSYCVEPQEHCNVRERWSRIGFH